jgi:hypothetical protein
VGGDHYVRHIEELDNCLDRQIRAGRWRSEEHHRLGSRDLLPMRAPSTMNLEAGMKYDVAVTPSSSPAAG